VPVPANFSIVTLGVADLDASIAFYEAWGWEMRGARHDGIVWFKTAATWLGLFPMAELAEDVGLENPATLPAFRGSTLAINVLSTEEVDDAFAVVVAAGATLVKAPESMEWGGYAGYVADPDGHLWEICYNPFFMITEGQIHIP
jgi:catechol 2,3-dioxygenase-like lactoylglutathione lyase family enzyme